MREVLAALAACGTFVCERAASESGITLHHVSVTSAASPGVGEKRAETVTVPVTSTYGTPACCGG